MKPKLTLELLRKAASGFAKTESACGEPSLYGVTDGKAVGTLLERKFTAFLSKRYSFEAGNSASGIDLPALGVDIKTTSIRRPQSSCPYTSASQKVYGLGYCLLVFVYDKSDDPAARTARLDIKHVIFVDAERTSDYQTTRDINDIIDRDGNEDDLVAFMDERRLPVDDIQAARLAGEMMTKRPGIGYLTISNALQWRLQYRRVIDKAGEVDGVYRVR